jgi:hypothetical protein
MGLIGRTSGVVAALAALAMTLVILTPMGSAAPKRGGIVRRGRAPRCMDAVDGAVHAPEVQVAGTAPVDVEKARAPHAAPKRGRVHAQTFDGMLSRTAIGAGAFPAASLLPDNGAPPSGTTVGLVPGRAPPFA